MNYVKVVMQIKILEMNVPLAIMDSIWLQMLKIKHLAKTAIK